MPFEVEKQYVSHQGEWVEVPAGGGGNFLPLTGGTVTGPFTATDVWHYAGRPMLESELSVSEASVGERMKVGLVSEFVVDPQDPTLNYLGIVNSLADVSTPVTDDYVVVRETSIGYRYTGTYWEEYSSFPASATAALLLEAHYAGDAPYGKFSLGSSYYGEVVALETVVRGRNNLRLESESPVTVTDTTGIPQRIAAADPVAAEEVTTKRYVDSRIWQGTQAEYDAITTKEPTVLYVVTG